MATATTQKDTFLSYGREPEATSFVFQLKEYLEKNGLTVCLSDDNMPLGQTFRTLDTCKALVAVITKKYIQSQHSKIELNIAKVNRKHLFPVFCENVSQCKEAQAVKDILRGIKWFFVRQDENDYTKLLLTLVKEMRLKMKKRVLIPAVTDDTSSFIGMPQLLPPHCQLQPAVQILLKYREKLSQLDTPIELIQSLYAEGIISKEAMCDVNSLGDVLSGSSMKELCTTIRANPAILRSLSTALLKSEVTVPLAKNLLSECDNEQLPDTRIQLLLHDIDWKVNRDAKFEYTIQELFTLLISSVHSSITSGEPDVVQLKKFLYHFFPELRPQLAHAKNADEVLELIEENCSIENVYCLEIVIAHNVMTAKPLLEKYKTEVDKAFEQTKVVDCLDVSFRLSSFPHILLKCDTLELQLSLQYLQNPLKEIKCLLSNIFNEFANRILMNSVQQTERCIVVKCHLLVDARLLLVQEFGDSLDELKLKGLIALKVGSFMLFKKNEEDGALEKQIIDLKEKLHQSSLTAGQMRSQLDLERRKSLAKTLEIEHLQTSFALKEKEKMKVLQDIDYLNEVTQESAEKRKLEQLLKEKQNTIKLLEFDLKKERKKNPAPTFEARVEDTSGYKVVGSIMYDKLLSKGSDGTRVFSGCLTNDKRKVAVKRIFKDNHSLTEKEKHILLRCDLHENIVRYFCIETTDEYHFLALEVCLASLREYIENNKEELKQLHIDNKTLIKDALNGLHHLHTLKIIHRDIKPENILLTRKAASSNEVKAVLCDFGISRETKGSRFSVTVDGKRGTYGWTAPEMLQETQKVTCTPAVDIFAMGCIIYYILSRGKHPFGASEPECHVNIGSKSYNYTLSELTGVDRKVVEHLITLMIANDRDARPTAGNVKNHCYFWSKEKQLTFLETTCSKMEENNFKEIENNSVDVIGPSGWLHSVHTDLQYTLQSAEFDGRSVRSLLKAIQYLKQHYAELPENIKAIIGAPQDDFLTYFITCFPSLLIHTYKNVEHEDSHHCTIDTCINIIQDTTDFEVVGSIMYNKHALLGKGSDETRVFLGCLKNDKRKIAVKRVLVDNDNYQLGEVEKDILLKCDQHENIICYFSIETSNDHHFLALECCAASLREYIEGKRENLKLLHVDDQALLKDALKGLHHLHKLKIIHRDIKPENILLTRKAASSNEVKAVLSDFGISRQTKDGRRSVTIDGRKGSYGWTAPELLKDDGKITCTSAVDIFAMGCIIYYVLSGGKHPFGTSEPECHVNCKSHDYHCTLKELTGVDKETVQHLIKLMIANDGDARPTAEKVLNHCFFWSNEGKLAFLDISANWIMVHYDYRMIEMNSEDIVGVSGWCPRVHQDLKYVLQIGEFENKSVHGLLCAIQYIKQHYTELPQNIKTIIGAPPNDFLMYFMTRFPSLLIHTYCAMESKRDEKCLKQFYT